MMPWLVHPTVNTGASRYDAIPNHQCLVTPTRVSSTATLVVTAGLAGAGLAAGIVAPGCSAVDPNP